MVAGAGQKAHGLKKRISTIELVHTSLMWVLKRKFFFSTYVEMYHTSTILWWPVATHFSASVSPLTSRFPLTMAISGIGTYHRLWPDDAPAECAGITPTPWAMMPMLGFVSYDRGHELLVPPPPNDAFVGLFSRSSSSTCSHINSNKYMCF